MAMKFCRNCGKQLHETAPNCPQCGAAQGNSPVKNQEIPEEIKGWSWGAFFLNWIWAIGNRSWIGLLTLIPGVGLIMAIVLGCKGREWAWKNRKWESVEHFNRVQKQWSYWGVVLFMALFFMGAIAGIGYGIYENRSAHQDTHSQDLSDMGFFEPLTPKTHSMPAGTANETIAIPMPRGDCDWDYKELLEQAGLSAQEIEIHGPVDEDFAGYGCPYRITPEPGTRLPSGSTVTYRSAWEGG